MTGLWSAALWLLKLAFKIIDAFTTPDLSATGPMGAVLPTTLWIGATLAVIMMFVQLTRGPDPPRRRVHGPRPDRHRPVRPGVGRATSASPPDSSPPPPDLTTGSCRRCCTSRTLSACRPERVVPGQDRRHHAGHRPGCPVAADRHPGRVLLRADHVRARGRADHPGGHRADLGRRPGQRDRQGVVLEDAALVLRCLLISPMAALLLGIGVKLSTGVDQPARSRRCAAASCATRWTAPSRSRLRERRPTPRTPGWRSSAAS